MSGDLTKDTVFELAAICITERRDGPDAFEAGGVNVSPWFSLAAIEANHERIKALLAQLPEQFHDGAGDGWSFLKGCVDRSGQRWTDLHASVDVLLSLGAAAGYVECQQPREMWFALPGDMPFFKVKAERGDPERVG